MSYWIQNYEPEQMSEQEARGEVSSLQSLQHISVFGSRCDPDVGVRFLLLHTHLPGRGDPCTPDTHIKIHMMNILVIINECDEN